MKESIIRAAREAGALAVGFAEAAPVDDAAFAEYVGWLDSGQNAGMEYMRNYPEIRRDPRLLLDGARTVISIAFSYAPDVEEANLVRKAPTGIACYAWGDDYHDVLRKRLKNAMKLLNIDKSDYRICIDSAPILERYWAVKAGVGTRCANGAVSVPGQGSRVFLTEIVTTLVIAPDAPLKDVHDVCDGCGACHRVCPAGALNSDGLIDCKRCLSYLTIEHRGDFDAEARTALDTPAGKRTLFGCDLCLSVCKLNKEETLSPKLPELGMRSVVREIMSTPPEQLEEKFFVGMTSEDFDIVFSKSPLRRAKLEGLRRNAECLSQFSHNPINTILNNHE